MAKRNILKAIRDWFKPKDNKKISEANRVTNYGGGVSTKAVQSEVKHSIVKAQAKREGEGQEERYSAFKATPPTPSSSSKSEKPTATKRDTFNRANAFKAGNADPKQELIQKQRDTQLAKKNARQANQKEKLRAADKLKLLTDEKYSTRKAGAPAYVKQGNYAADPLVAKYNVLKHPYATSAVRGATDVTTLGLSNLAISKLSNDEAKEAERFYQANKSKGAEIAGSLAGGALLYGGTAGTFEGIGANAISRAARTQLGRKIGAESLAKIMAGNGAKAAIARSLVGDAIQDSTIGLIDTMAGVAARDDLKTTDDYLKAILEGQAINYGMGLFGNAVSHGAPIARKAWGDFADESRKLHIVPKGVADIAEKTINSKTETIASGRNWLNGEDIQFWKDGNTLYVGNPNGEYKSFGKDLPENRIKAEDEFDFLNNKRTQEFREARGEKTKKPSKHKTEERPRPEGVKKYSDKQLLEMKKSGSINQLSSDEYKYYIYDRPEDDPFFEKWDAIGADGKTVKQKETKAETPKTEQPKTEQAKAEKPETGKTTKTLTKKQLENKKKRSDKRLKEIESEIKKSPYASQYEQDALSAKYTKELEYRKKLDEQIKEAEASADGSITVSKGKKKAAKEVDESNVIVTKGKEELIEESPKPQKVKTNKQKKAKTEAKVETKTEAKTEVKAEVKAEEPKPSKKVTSLENKIRNSDEKIKNFKKQIAQKKKEGASEKSIANLETQRKAEIERREGFKKELKELTGSSEVSKTVEPPKADTKTGTEIKTTGNKKVDSLEKRVAYANDNINKLKKTLKEKKANGASEKSIAYTEEQLTKEKTRLKEIKKDLKSAKKASETKPVTEVVAETAVKTEKGTKPAAETLKSKAENTDTLATYKKNQKASIEKAKAEEANTVNIEGKTYSTVDESPFDEASTRTKREKPKFTSKEEAKVKSEKKANAKIKEAKGKAKTQANKFRRNPAPKGEGLHKSTVKSVIGKELDEAINPPTFKDYIEAKKVHAKGQASNEKEVVSRAGTSLMNATTDEAQRDFLRNGWRDGDFNYRKIRNSEKYADVMKRFVDEPDTVSRELIRYNNDLSSLSADKVVDTHYQAHCVMKMLRKEIDNPALSEAERAAAKEVYSSAASLSQKLSSLSGQVNQFQGVMVHCTPAKRADNALDNIVSILDSSRGYRKKTKIEIDGKMVALSDNAAKRRQQIRALVLENEDISKNLKKVFDAATEQEYGEAMSDLLLSTYKLNHATGFDYLQQWRYLSMLGNPKTHLRNLVGNITFGGIRNLSNTVRSIEENALGNYAKNHGLEIDYHGGLSPKAYRQARIKKLAKDDASKAAWESFEKHKSEILGQNKFDTPQMHQLFSHLSEANTKILGWEDDLFRAPAYREQYIKSYKKFAKKGEMTDEILSRIHNEALKESQIATFNEFNELAQILSKSQRGLYDANATVGQKSVAILSNALMPFTKVPSNILKQSVNYTPAGVAKGISHILDAASKGDSALFNTALDELASGITGTGIATIGYFLGKNTDIFTTNAGSEDAAAKFKKQQGVQNYSATVNLPNGKSYSFTLDWLVPASCTFFMGVELAKQFENGIKGANFGEAFGNISQVASRVIDPVLETSMLSSIYNIVENSRKSSSYDDQKSFAEIALREIVQSYVSSYIPTALGQVARSFIYDSDKMIAGEGDWDYFLNSLKVKMGLANTDIITDRLGEDVNAYGEVKNKKTTKSDYAKSFVKNAVLPTNIQEVDLTDVDKQKIKEYEDYVAAGGDPKDKEYLFPKKQYRKNFTYGKKGADPVDVKMTNEQVSLYNKAKTTGGAEGMRVVLEGAMFNHYDKDSSGKRTILKNGYDAEQKEKLIRKFEGKSMREVEEWLYKQPQFRSATEEEQRKVLNHLWSYTSNGASTGAKRVGEQAVVEAQGGNVDEYNFKNEVSKTKQNNLKDAIDSGVVTYEEIVDFARNAGKTYYYDNDEGGTSSTYYNKKQMLEYLESKGYSAEKAEALFNAFKASNAKPYGAPSGRRGYGRRGYRRRGRRGGSGKAPAHNISAFKAKKISTPKSTVSVRPSESVKITPSASKIKTGSIASAISNSGSRRGSSANYNTASVKYNTASAVKKPPTKKKTTAKATPPKVKFKKYEV